MDTEQDIGQKLISVLADLKYDVRPDIRDRGGRERNFRTPLNALDRVNLTDAELAPMANLYPLLTQRAGGRDISGLNAYEQ